MKNKIKSKIASVIFGLAVWLTKLAIGIMPLDKHPYKTARPIEEFKITKGYGHQ